MTTTPGNGGHSTTYPIKIPPTYCGSIRRPDIEPLSSAMRGTWPETIQAPAVGAIAVEHAQAPGCDQLKTI